MRKRVFGRKLGRDKNQRKALFRGLVASLVKEGEMVTTVAKAKAIRPLTEKLITKAKKGGVGERRQILHFLGRRALVNRLVDEIAPLVKERKGGYLRLVRTGRRKGDNAPLVKISFVEKIEKHKEVKTNDETNSSAGN